MSDIHGSETDQHDWKRGESFQWGHRGIHAYDSARTPYECAKCGKRFVHFYHQEPNIYAAMEAQGIQPDKCQSGAPQLTENTKGQAGTLGLKPGDDCPKCGGELHASIHRYQDGPGNYPDCSWLVCLDCNFQTDPE